MKLIKSFSIFIIAMIFSVLSCKKEADPVIAIIPQPLNMVQTTGIFQLTPKVKIMVSDEAVLADQAAFLQNRVKKATGFDLQIVKEASGKVISLRVEAGLSGTLATKDIHFRWLKKIFKFWRLHPQEFFMEFKPYYNCYLLKYIQKR